MVFKKTKMDDQGVLNLKAKHEELLRKSKLQNGQGQATNIHAVMTQDFRRFLDAHKAKLEVLKEKWDIHRLEEGKVKFRLVAEERVSVAFLQESYAAFTKEMNEFIEYMTGLENRCNQPLAASFRNFRQEAVAIVMKMLEISLVLESQPDSTNYDKGQNTIPTLLCLGAENLSDFSCDESACEVTIVSESDLKGMKGDKDFGTVKGLKGVAVKQENPKKSTTTKSKASKTKQASVEINLGSWSIAKDQLSPADKGSAHKDWVRLKYTVRVKYQGITKTLSLVSLPFNIRKGSVQMFTFIGALMWYFYCTEDPYTEFSVPTRLPTSTFLDMLVTRLEVIGRKLSPVAKDFLGDLLKELSSDRTTELFVELETVTRGPPSSKKKEQSQKTPTVSETITDYGFFTWFYALVHTIDTSGYLNKLWLDGYVYDLCGPNYAMDVVAKPDFLYEAVLIRPSMSNIYSHQGTRIHMGFSLFYKVFRQGRRDKVYSINQEIDDLERCGLYNCLTTNLSLTRIYMQDMTWKDVALVRGVTPEKIKDYHDTRFSNTRGPKVQGCDDQILHCSTCRCTSVALNAIPDGQARTKKGRNPSGNSDHMSVTSDYQNDLHHKSPARHSVGSPSGSQMPSPASMTSPCSLDHNGTADSDNESYTSNDESRFHHFDQTISPGGLDTQPCKNSLSLTCLPPVRDPARSTLLANFHNAFSLVSGTCSEQVIEELTATMHRVLGSAASPPPQPQPHPLPHSVMSPNVATTTNTTTTTTTSTDQELFGGSHNTVMYNNINSDYNNSDYNNINVNNGTIPTVFPTDSSGQQQINNMDGGNPSLPDVNGNTSSMSMDQEPLHFDELVDMSEYFIMNSSSSDNDCYVPGDYMQILQSIS